VFSDADMAGDIDGQWSSVFMAVAEIEGGGVIYVLGEELLDNLPLPYLNTQQGKMALKRLPAMVL
jgi:hypothetical protein